MTVSPEELALHDNMVVCPQCLTTYYVEGNKLTASEVAAQRHPVTGGDASSAGYCYNCGKALPAGINFCPYCGVDLMAPFQNKANASQPYQSGVDAEQPQPEQTDKPAAHQQVRSKAATTTQERSDVLRQITSYSRSVAQRTTITQRGSRPSKRFQVFAYITIALLLALLVCIIVAGNNIQPAA